MPEGKLRLSRSQQQGAFLMPLVRSGSVEGSYLCGVLSPEIIKKSGFASFQLHLRSIWATAVSQMDFFDFFHCNPPNELRRNRKIRKN
jgi:hypothetical protein